MTVADFLEQKNMSTKDFADIIGVSVSIALLWDRRASTPRLLHAMKIKALSKNKIKDIDLLIPQDHKRL